MFAHAAADADLWTSTFSLADAELRKVAHVFVRAKSIKKSAHCCCAKAHCPVLETGLNLLIRGTSTSPNQDD